MINDTFVFNVSEKAFGYLSKDTSLCRFASLLNEHLISLSLYYSVIETLSILHYNDTTGITSLKLTFIFIDY